MMCLCMMDLSTGLDLDRSNLIGLGLIGLDLNNGSNQVWVRSNWMGQIWYGSNLNQVKLDRIWSGRVDPDLTLDLVAALSGVDDWQRR